MNKKQRRKEVTKLLDQLFEIHKVYKKQTKNEKHIMISEKCEPIFKELETLGVGRAFSEIFLAFGNEFLLHEWGIKWSRMRKVTE